MDPMASQTLELLNQHLATQHSERGAFGMCCSHIDMRVVSSEYFYEMVKPLINKGGEQTLLRPDKFKAIRAAYKFDDDYQKLASEKAELRRLLELNLIRQKPVFINQMIVRAARKKKQFNEIGLPQLDERHASKVAELQAAYEQYQKSFSEFPTKVMDLESVFKLVSLEEVKLQLGDNDIEKIQSSWDGESTTWYQKFEEVWPKICEDMYKIRRQSDSLKGFSEKIAKILAPKSPYIKDPIFHVMCKLISEGLGKIAAEHNHNTSIQNASSTFLADPLLIQLYADSVREKDLAHVNFILQEQKKHSLARFCPLIDNYEAFIRHAAIVEKMVEEIFSGGGLIVRQTLDTLLEHSHYAAPSKEETKLLKKNKDGIQKNNDGIPKSRLNELKHLSVKDTHHSHFIMGFEEEDYFLPKDREEAIHIINMLLQLTGTGEDVGDFQRAHTFPFPAMFNWEPIRIREILGQLGISIPSELSETKRYISSQFFKHVRAGLITSEQLDSALMKELEEIKHDVEGNPGLFIFHALDLLKQYHLRVFSETELVPDFINTLLDGLSEWTFTDDNYKRNIANIVRECIQRPHPAPKEIIADRFRQFHARVTDNIEAKVSDWKKKPDSIYHLFLRIGAIQVQQAQLLSQLHTGTKVTTVALSQLVPQLPTSP